MPAVGVSDDSVHGDDMNGCRSQRSWLPRTTTLSTRWEPRAALHGARSQPPGLMESRQVRHPSRKTFLSTRKKTSVYDTHKKILLRPLEKKPFRAKKTFASNSCARPCSTRVGWGRLACGLGAVWVVGKFRVFFPLPTLFFVFNFRGLSSDRFHFIVQKCLHNTQMWSSLDFL